MLKGMMSKVRLYKILFTLIPFLIALFIFQSFSSICLAQNQPRFSNPPVNQTLLFVGQDLDTIQNYLKKVDNHPDGFMVYTSVHDIRGLYEPVDHGAGVQHAQVLLEKYPHAKFQIGLYMVDNLREVAEGKWDENLKILAQWIKQTSEPVYLRIGYEFDMPDNHYDPEQYKKAFQYIVDYLRKEKADNAFFVWHSYGYLNPGKSPMKWYPGDDYVDWFGLSFFRAFNTANYKSFLKLSQMHGKPLMLAEATAFGVGTLDGRKSWNMWFKPFFDFIEANDIPAVSYINSDWESQPMFKGQGWGNCRIEENLFVRNKWLEKIKTSRFKSQ